MPAAFGREHNHFYTRVLLRFSSSTGGADHFSNYGTLAISELLMISQLG
jgi:hypothetical protein